MDYIILKDLIFVSMVETAVILMFGIVLIQGRSAIMEKGFFFRFLIAVIGIVLLERLTRILSNNIAIISYLNTLAYVFALKFAIGFNWRTSIIVGGISMTFLIVTENLSSPYMAELMNKFNTEGASDVRFKVSLFPRIMQLSVLLLICIKNITLFDKQLLNTKWSHLSRKVTIYYVVLIVYLNILFSANYGDIYVKIIKYKIDTSYIFTNINIILFQTVAFFIAILISYYRTSDLETHREIFNADPNRLFEAMLKVSSPKQVDGFKTSLETYFEAKEGGDCTYEKITIDTYSKNDIKDYE